MWTLWSGIYLYILFEMTVPLMELLPEENFIFITTMFAAAFCFYKVSFKLRHFIADVFIDKKTIAIIVFLSTDAAKSGQQLRGTTNR